MVSGSAAPVSSQKACSSGTKSSMLRLSEPTRISGRSAALCSKTSSRALAVGVNPETLIRPDNRSMEDFVPLLQAFCELTGAADPETIVALPTRDVLPFQNLSPHPELQEERAVALWKIATGAVSIIASPITATALRLRSAEYYADLARIVRRGDTFDTDPLLRHLNTVGYTSTDVVEMPGEYALRGGILDVYSPEADRPVRIEFFGDEVESIRKFE